MTPDERTWRARLDGILASLVVERRDETVNTERAGRPVRDIDLGLSGHLEGVVWRGGLFDGLAEDDYAWMVDTDVALWGEGLLHHVQVRPGEPLPLPLTARDRPPGDVQPVRGAFSARAGAGLRLLLPVEAGAWNGRLAVLTSGTGIYRDLTGAYEGGAAPLERRLVARAGGTAGFSEGTGANLYAELLIDDGFAVAWIRKDEVRPPDGVNHARPADGGTLRVSHHSHLGYTLAMIERARRECVHVLHGEPERTYLYGHSSGAMTARLVNLRPEANIAGDGGHLVDGILADDAGGGMYLPVAFDDAGADTVLVDSHAIARFVPQVDVTRPLFRPAAYLPVKRANARMLVAKGVGDRHRHLEVAGASHFDAGMAGVGGTPQAPDLGGLWQALWRRMDAWAGGGAAPPPGREGPDAVALPEQALPLGELDAPGGRAFTRFTPFDGRDGRETSGRAWRRRGLLADGEPLTLDRLRARWREHAEALERDGLFSPEASRWLEGHAAELLRRSGAVL